MDDLSLLEWLWHDSVLHSIHIWCRDDGLLNVAVLCELHPDEDRSALAAFGITSPLVQAELRDAFDLEILHFASTADRGVITMWEIEPLLGASRHIITLNTGARLRGSCRAIWLAQA